MLGWLADILKFSNDVAKIGESESFGELDFGSSTSSNGTGVDLNLPSVKVSPIIPFFFSYG